MQNRMNKATHLSLPSGMFLLQTENMQGQFLHGGPCGCHGVCLSLALPLGCICGGGDDCHNLHPDSKDLHEYELERCLHCKHFKHANMPLLTSF